MKVRFRSRWYLNYICAVFIYLSYFNHVSNTFSHLQYFIIHLLIVVNVNSLSIAVANNITFIDLFQPFLVQKYPLGYFFRQHTGIARQRISSNSYKAILEITRQHGC